MRTTDRKRIGSVTSWVISRLLQVALLIFCLQSIRSNASWQLSAALAGMLALTVYLFYPLAYADADASGITFRRYLKPHHASWDEILEAIWTPSFSITDLKMKLDRPRGFTHRVEFNVITNLGQLFKVYMEGWTPEVVMWVANRARFQ